MRLAFIVIFSLLQICEKYVTIIKAISGESMITGDRIKQRRLQLGLNAADIAAKIGKDRATLYRYESNEIEKLPIGVIDPLAEALHCSPAYLMGWTDEVQESDRNQAEFPLSDREKALILAYRANPDMQSAVDKLLGLESEEIINKKDA